MGRSNKMVLFESSLVDVSQNKARKSLNWNCVIVASKESLGATWVAQPLKRLPLAGVMILGFWNGAPATLFSQELASPSPAAPPLLVLALSLKRINEILKKEKKVCALRSIFCSLHGFTENHGCISFSFSFLIWSARQEAIPNCLTWKFCLKIWSQKTTHGWFYGII